jgi:branched-chain amino acid transport system permease protein
MATQWNLLAGFSGLTSFGQQASLGLGAYALYLVAAGGVNPFAAIVPAALIAALVYWATLAVAVISVAGVFLLVRRTFGLDARAVGSDPSSTAWTCCSWC